MTLDIHLDLETADPDDVMALALLATHPRVCLRSVSIFPGGLDQVGLVRYVLNRLGVAIPIGAAGLDDGKHRVSQFHYRWLGQIENGSPDGSPSEVIQSTLQNHRNVMLVTGAPLRNVAAALDSAGPEWFTSWVCQGGFAGDNVVSEADQLPKFLGRRTCPTYNLNGDPTAAEKLLKSERFQEIRMVAKNVCHGQFFGLEDIARTPRGAHRGLDMLLDGMTTYCERKPEGKALHDVVAAVLAIAPSAATWARGQPYRERGAWGFSPNPDSPIQICTSLNRASFEEALVR